MSGVAGTGGCAAAFHAGCKNGALLAILNDTRLGGIVNVAYPSSCGPIKY
jgi:hypothetical protein